MRLKHLALIASLLTANIAFAETPAQITQNQTVSTNAYNFSFNPVISKALPAVVYISTSQSAKVTNPFEEFKNEIPEGHQYDLFREFLEREFSEREPKQKKATSLGSGFIVDPSGYIVTNYHVIADATEVKVTFSDNSEKSLKAKVIGKDAKTDLALLKIDVKDPLPFLKFADSDKTRVGDWVIAIGNPFGIGVTSTAGIISAKSRLIAGLYDEFIQIDASINKGNSGGPSINLDGDVIGVNSVIISPSGGNVGIGLAIPSNLVQKIVNELKTKGSIERSWLGVKIQPVNEDIAKSLGLADAKGALVSEVVKGGPADKAGIKIADIITKFDGQVVDSSQRLPRIVGETTPGKKVTIELLRDGKLISIAAVVEKPEEEKPAVESSSSNGEKAVPEKTMLGMKLENLTATNRQKLKIAKDVNGVLVNKVIKSSNAAEVGIRPGDVISHLNRQKIASVAEFEKALEEIKKTSAAHVLMYVYRGGSGGFITIPLEDE